MPCMTLRKKRGGPALTGLACRPVISAPKSFASSPRARARARRARQEDILGTRGHARCLLQHKGSRIAEDTPEWVQPGRVGNGIPAELNAVPIADEMALNPALIVRQSSLVLKVPRAIERQLAHRRRPPQSAPQPDHAASRIFSRAAIFCRHCSSRRRFASARHARH